MSGFSECLNEQISIYYGNLRNMEFCRCQTPTHARCFEWKAAFYHALAKRNVAQMICKGGAEPPMFAHVCSLEVPGQNSMVSRDSPLTQAASTCKLDALVT